MIVDVVERNTPLRLSLGTLGRAMVDIICAKAQLLVGTQPVNPQCRMPTGHLLLNVRDVPGAQVGETPPPGSWSKQGLLARLEGRGYVGGKEDEIEKIIDKSENDERHATRAILKGVYEKLLEKPRTQAPHEEYQEV